MRNVVAGLIGVGIVGFSVYWFGMRRPDPIPPVAAADAEAIRKAPPIDVAPSDWPWWRGAKRDGIATGTPPPTIFSSSENVIWKAVVPGRGHSTPILVGDKVLVTTADEDKQTMSLLCYARNDGKRLWERQLHEGGFPRKHPKNSQASATPASDGKLVFTVFVAHGKLLVDAVDLDGKIIWQKEVGDFQPEHGFGSSPVLYHSLVIVAGDHGGAAYIAGLDRGTGEVKWLQPRGLGMRGSYATPIIAKVGGKDQLLLSGQSSTTSYDPASGKVLWKSEGPALVTANTIACADDRLIVSGGYPENAIMCLSADGSGKTLWRKTQKMYVPSMVCKDGKVYGVRDDGIAVCFNLKDGKKIWQERLRGSAFSGSATLVGDLLFVPSEEGKVYVLKAGEPFEIVASNDMGEGIMASPVISGGRLYLRTAHHLYCIGAKR